jgi:hypothetical protein
MTVIHVSASTTIQSSGRPQMLRLKAKDSELLSLMVLGIGTQLGLTKYAHIFRQTVLNSAQSEQDPALVRSDVCFQFDVGSILHLQ